MKNMGILLIVIGIMATVLGCHKEKESKLVSVDGKPVESNKFYREPASYIDVNDDAYWRDTEGNWHFDDPNLREPKLGFDVVTLKDKNGNDIQYIDTTSK